MTNIVAITDQYVNVQPVVSICIQHWREWMCARGVAHRICILPSQFSVIQKENAVSGLHFGLK